jgi:hypothetical protein
MGGKAAEDSIGFHVGEVDRGSGCVGGRYDERIGCDGKVTAMTSAYGEGGAGRRMCTVPPHRRGQHSKRASVSPQDNAIVEDVGQVCDQLEALSILRQAEIK